MFLVLTPAPAWLASAAPGCVAPGVFDEAIPVGPAEGFEGWSLSVLLSHDRLPPAPSLAATSGDRVCDLTTHFPEFLAAAGDAAGRDPRAVARLAARAAFVDALPDPVLVGVPVTEARDGGVRVAFTTWHERNGAVVDWDVLVQGADVKLRFAVRALAVGDFVAATEGPVVLPGDTDRALLPPSPTARREVRGPNVDGTQWRVAYFTERYANDAEADFYGRMVLEEAQRVYAVEAAHGFRSQDPDRILDITLDGCNCITGEPDARIRLDAKLGGLMQALGLQYPSERDFTRVIAGHELFHHMQYGINRWAIGTMITEGQARFMETVFDTEASFHPATLPWATDPNGFNFLLRNPDYDIRQRSYDFGIFWAYLYAHDGGSDVIRLVLEESAGVQGDSRLALPKAVDRALSRVPEGVRTHATFEAAFVDFLTALHTREGWVWGDGRGGPVKDWGPFLDRVEQLALVRPAERVKGDLSSWGADFYPLRAGTGIAAFPGDPNARFVLATRGPGGESRTPVTGPAATWSGISDGLLLAYLPYPEVPNPTLARPPVVGGAYEMVYATL